MVAMFQSSRMQPANKPPAGSHFGPLALICR